MTPVAQVLIDASLPQLDRLFDYTIPADLAGQVTPGVRVKVPLRSAGRMMFGYVVALVERDPERPLSEIDAVVSPVVVMPDALYTLARRCADRAAGAASDILRLVIPKRMVRAEKAWLSAPPPPIPRIEEAVRDWAQDRVDTYPGAAVALADGERMALDAPPRPSGERAVGSWAEVVAAMAILMLARGSSALIVVPDHRDQAQVVAAMEGRVPTGSLVAADARQSGPDRYAAYLRMLSAVPCIVVGNRSTVYAPAHRVGLVALWDDGDPLLAEPLSPGVHARDAALLRQEQEGSALVMIGHTRTTDVQRLVQVGWVRELPASRPVRPRVVLSSTTDGEAGVRVPSSAFAAAREALRTGPVLVQVARPGYAPVLVCAECRTPTRCPKCAGPLRARRAGAAPECGWCGRRFPAWVCASCSSTRLRMASSGSERTADELGRAFPNTRVILADGDHPVTEVDARPALVVATRGAEPQAAGGYRAVILLDGDRMLLTEQLRIGESCLRWWSNAAALAAPGAPVHLVGVTGPLSRALATWTQPAYARAELSDRAPLHMPPAVRVAAVTGTQQVVARALAHLRTDVPMLPAQAVLGPTSGDGIDDQVRALVRFDYALGAPVASSLRASVITEALRGRRARKDRGPRSTPTLKVRLDVPELDL
ncbi:primosomal protein N' [Microbacterium sp.]|uniref:primosomal protein N' family DNA-binding protein n=1 Tax=Microbacterium sp. TaxID=51671 RepID=UPI003A8A18EF